MAVTKVNEQNFQAEVLESAETVLVDFYADWCGPCKMLSPVVDEIAGEVSGCKVVKLNVDEAPNVAARYNVMSIPTLMVFRQGEAVRPLRRRAEQAAHSEYAQGLKSRNGVPTRRSERRFHLLFSAFHQSAAAQLAHGHKTRLSIKGQKGRAVVRGQFDLPYLRVSGQQLPKQRRTHAPALIFRQDQ